MPFFVRLMNDWSGVNTPPLTPCWLAMSFRMSMSENQDAGTLLGNFLGVLQLLHFLAEDFYE